MLRLWSSVPGRVLPPAESAKILRHDNLPLRSGVCETTPCPVLGNLTFDLSFIHQEFWGLGVAFVALLPSSIVSILTIVKSLNCYHTTTTPSFHDGNFLLV